MTQQAKQSVKEKWGEAVDSGETGFQALPDVLIRNQLRLGLDSTDVLVLLNIFLHWWKTDDLPHPRPSTIATRMGVSRRTVERRIRKMQKLGLLIRLPSETKITQSSDTPLTVRRFNFDGLKKRLELFALETRTSKY